MDVSRLVELVDFKICRTCLAVDCEMVDVYDDSDNNSGLEEPLWIKLETITSTPVTVDDGLSPHVCLTCKTRLNESFAFKQLCHRSFVMLKQYTVNSAVSQLKSQLSLLDGQEDPSVLTRIEETPCDSQDPQDSPPDVNEEEIGPGEIINIGLKMPDSNEQTGSVAVTSETLSVRSEMVTLVSSQTETVTISSETGTVIISSETEAVAISSETEALAVGSELEAVTLETEPVAFSSETETDRSALESVISSEVNGEIVPAVISVIELSNGSSEKKSCKLCKFTASSSRGLSLHIAHLHKQLKGRWCSTCQCEVDNLRQHNIEEHVEKGDYGCNLCNKKFISQGHLKEHLQCHMNVRPFSCSQCSKQFISLRHLRVHERTHSGERPYICSYCPRAFTQSGSLRVHIRSRHPDQPVAGMTCNHQCNRCKNKYTTIKRLAIHKVKVCHDDDIDYPEDVEDRVKYVVAVLNKNSKVQTEFLEIKQNGCKEMEDKLLEETKNQKLIQKFDIEGDKMFKETLEAVAAIDKKEIQDMDAAVEKNKEISLCTFCGKTFKTSSKLRLHQRVHTGETPYHCQFCEKSFTSRGQLVVHLRTHTGEKPHICNVCGRAFAQSSVLGTHMRLHTGRPEECQVCGRRFCRPAELRTHMRRHTGEKPYLCTICGQGFVQRSHLVEHCKTHSDERPFSCSICNRSFKQNSALRSHVQIHTGSKPFKCTQCPYACRQSYALKQHMRQHVPDTQTRPDRVYKCLICERFFNSQQILTAHMRCMHSLAQ